MGILDVLLFWKGCLSCFIWLFLKMGQPTDHVCPGWGVVRFVANERVVSAAVLGVSYHHPSGSWVSRVETQDSVLTVSRSQSGGCLSTREEGVMYPVVWVSDARSSLKSGFWMSFRYLVG